ncbi:phosphoribosylanthranilate isomerase [Sansalvadorimonas sp. 2012CJ34-2]|uniref:N-(5'-phosphoribosyl)anthranilate isomerase n=1 Tax=Parendozoicomonas callyspongiae TaxID=2942213 RepID=A0ABT0PBC8_9GAMM|nr:phosphoribosylanthranilate isomerase [Sansalvadorimonas sp. 2012CJ34-2]MCL6268689.1 phosphoribosylanthranilate isomerase [Sansalvadorimonas sp. 2012CJ34-2]
MLFENTSGTRVKICGIRQPEHAKLAVENGADAIGLMFYEPSPRHLSLEEGRAVSEAVAGKAVRIAVVVNPSPEYLQQILDNVELDAIQFHGDEENTFCNRWNLPWLKAVRVRDDMDVAEQLERWPDASAYVLDAYTPDVYGGTGEAFDWGKFPKHVNRPLMLAGGLKPDNVAQAVVTIKPWAIDVSSGVESSRGVKDETLIRGFMQEVNYVRNQVR